MGVVTHAILYLPPHVQHWFVPFFFSLCAGMVVKGFGHLAEGQNNDNGKKMAQLQKDRSSQLLPLHLYSFHHIKLHNI